MSLKVEEPTFDMRPFAVRRERGEDREMTELRMEISVEGSSKTVAVQLEERLRLTFNLRIPVSVVPADALPKFEMKAKRWLRA